MMRTQLLLLVTLATACKGNPHAAENAPAPAPTPAPKVATGSGSDTTGELPDPTGVPGTQDMAGLGNIIEQVQKEAHERPPVKITAEKLHDALDAAGIKFNSWKQVLAHNVGANFCASGKILDANGGQKGVVVCEYSTPERAKAAIAELEKNPPFPDSIPKREAKDATTVAVINDLDQTLQKQVFDVFQTL